MSYTFGLRELMEACLVLAESAPDRLQVLPQVRHSRLHALALSLMPGHKFLHLLKVLARHLEVILELGHPPIRRRGASACTSDLGQHLLSVSLEETPSFGQHLGPNHRSWGWHWSRGRDDNCGSHAGPHGQLSRTCDDAIVTPRVFPFSVISNSLINHL